MGQDVQLNLNMIKPLDCDGYIWAILMNMNGVELDKDDLNIQFKSDKDVVKISLFYFIELAMMGGRGDNTWSGPY
ncbi:hypothetical protein E5676_scaffold280G00360 [Cucumis melo var. makuwa]|uniref:Uncharacterized protein n=1 Tax=Cucumis melo var. makuwa TaxID=1194695 RepID=A0A5A7TUW5_CUCMM|nr:hypothetical protein E6C27_scaffold243G001380 [Cucumis melo var. makuwa]TYK02628.1 hypothetical protein E5676_scaffold280G00360 [Cucumis melo var. makuwa]